MTCQKSDKLPGFIRFDVKGIRFHVWQSDAGNRFIMSYWDALSLEQHLLSNGLALPTKQQALVLIQSGALKSDEFVKSIFGPVWLMCWLDDYAAIEVKPDTYEYSILDDASGLGQVAPVWFVEY